MIGKEIDSVLLGLDPLGSSDAPNGLAAYVYSGRGGLRAYSADRAWVMREARGQSTAWQDAGLPVTAIAVNLSGMAFREEISWQTSMRR